MAMAMPIVATPMGIRGFPLIDGESVLIAQNARQFAAHAVTLLHESERRATMGNAARKVALETVDWRVLGERLRDIVAAVAREIPSNMSVSSHATLPLDS